MYADRIEAEARSVKTRISGDTQLPGDKALGTVRGKISFKRSGAQGRPRGRSDVDDKWQHDLFEESQTFLQTSGVSGTGSGDLRSLIASKQQAKLGGVRLSSRVGSGGLLAAKAAVVAASDLRQQLAGGRRRSSRLALRKKPGGAATAVGSGLAAAVAQQKRITVTLRNDEELEEEDEGEEPAVAVARPTVVRGGRGSLLVTSRVEDDEDTMDMEADAMPGQVPLMAGSRAPGALKGMEGVKEFLGALGLAKYSALFSAEEIDMHALLQMKDADLKELGIPMGPRKKILQAAENL